MSLYKMFMIACRQIVHGSVQSCGCRIANGFCRIEQIDLSVLWLRAILDTSIPSLVGMFVYREETTEGDEYSIGGEEVDFLKYVEKMGRVFNVGR